MSGPARRGVVAITACLLCVTACQGRPGLGPPTWVLTPTQLDELALDRTWEGRRADGTAFAVYTGPDGRQRLRETQDGGTVLTDDGVWSLEGNASCSRWQRSGGDGKHCVVVAPGGEDGYRAYNPDGSLHAIFRVHAGNPNRL